MSWISDIRDRVFGTAPKVAADARTGGGYTLVNSYAFNGEKNLGEIGPAKDYYLDYGLLRVRSYQAMLESEIASTVLNKTTLWMISKGLKLQSEPNETVLKTEGVQVDTKEFVKTTEARFGVWSRSRKVDHSGSCTLGDLAKEAYKNCKVGGDVLVVLRLKDGMPTVQLIDGAHVGNPVPYSGDNCIKYGVEVDESGAHVAYHVKTKSLTYERIPAYDSQGLRVAFLVYGDRYRIDSVRGIPLIAQSLETLKKLERYKEATVGSAEERQKIVMQIVHNQESTGEDIFFRNAAKAMGTQPTDKLPETIDGEQLANRVAATTNKSTYNMPIGSKMEVLESKNELYFKDFYSTNADIICAAVGIPPNVAFSIYNDSFSASRAATKDWEHTITVSRDDFGLQFYQRIYDYWLHVEILKNKVDAPGYLKAFRSGNVMVLDAYRTARFTGAMFPHIDPEKEVRAERLKLGPLADNYPLTSVERSTEVLNGGDSDANLSKFSEEIGKLDQAFPKEPTEA